MKTISFEFYGGDAPKLLETSPFCINDSCSALSLLFRVLAGTCEISNRITDENVKLSKNYFFSDYRENISRDLGFLDSFEEGLELTDYEEYAASNRLKNAKFYQSFLGEISGCLYNEELGRHTLAFVHLYRAYEHLSYAFPMVYASRAVDYIGTFENLRNWMTADGKGAAGELKFFLNFIKTLLNGDPILSSSIDIVIETKAEYKELLFKSLV